MKLSATAIIIAASHPTAITSLVRVLVALTVAALQDVPPKLPRFLTCQQAIRVPVALTAAALDAQICSFLRWLDTWRGSDGLASLAFL